MDQSAQINTNTSPSSGSLFKAHIGYFVVIALLLAGVVAANVWIFGWAEGEGKKVGWKKLAQENKEPQGKYVTDLAIVYELEGVLAQMKDDSIVLEKDGQTREFSTEYAQFAVTSPLSYFAEWSRKIIVDNEPGQFRPGDQVTLHIKGNELNDNLYVTKIRKVGTGLTGEPWPTSKPAQLY